MPDFMAKHHSRDTAAACASSVGYVEYEGDGGEMESEVRSTDTHRCQVHGDTDADEVLRPKRKLN